MSFELSTLFALGIGYLAILFGIAFITEKGWIPERVVRHPIVYVLSLGVFASVWSYYASTGNAFRDGFGYLAPFIGISLAFLLSPLILRPILNLTKTYQLSSLADLLAFRYRSPWAGTLTTLIMLIGVMPLLALQIQAVANTVGLLSPDATQTTLALTFCLLITLFAIFFGTGKGSGRERHDGLVMTIAFESLVKLLAVLLVGWFAVHEGFGGFAAMEEWLQDQPELLRRLKEPAPPGTFQVQMLIFFTAAVATPHMFYITFHENNHPRALNVASWGLPLYFLLLSLPVLPILWAGLNSGSLTPMEYYPVTLGIDYDTPLMTLIGFLGGLSAASGLIIVITLALSTMCLNHLILPIWQPRANQDIYRWLLWKRRALIAALIWGGFLFYYIPSDSQSIRAVSNIGLVGSLQFLPAVIALLYWPRGNKKGFMAGVAAGTVIWVTLLVLPVATGFNLVVLDGMNTRVIIALSLICNIILFITVSLMTRSSTEEKVSADICSVDNLRRQRRARVSAGSADEFISQLTKPLGERTATREVMQALRDLNMDKKDKRPKSLRLLRGRLEANLSGLLGPAIAHDLIDRFLPYTANSEPGASDVAAIENRIEAYRSNLSGMAADLDNLRRYHRQILMDLPLGVCSLGPEDQIIMWNHAMESLTGITPDEAAGLQLGEIGEPWFSLLNQFRTGDNTHQHKATVNIHGSKRYVSLHKAVIEKSASPRIRQDGVIILLEDLTETELLEEELAHSERLASIGRLAAGVAHEIGNPITGIACLAQNVRDETQNDEIRNMARQIIEQTDRTSRIVQSLVNFAHSGSHNKSDQRKERVSISECIDEAITLVSLNKKGKYMNFDVRCDEPAFILGDSQQLLQVLVNLINNARDASPEQSTISVNCERIAASVQISVSDEGTGIPDSIKDRIFEPFFTTKEPGEGTGLGLSLVYSLVENLGGHIDIMNASARTDNPGAKVILSFPCYDAQHAPNS
ncbi:ATP-binding protein [Pseudohongiella sp. SYSU M77423]|uniref:ATP-binding protein n=1 Tax=unclassified Pseudohongiella TaxID=2629611 RepID=UPI001F290996|nr:MULTISPECIES: ATP-binding protein [unclassified Pseudohongiella]MDH7944634.1 ATP-binding protein [Pseudohongiella sp. SYSU M77423]